MMYEIEPKNFNPIFEVVTCYIEHDKKIILLHRQDNKLEGNTWGDPAGKVDKGETIIDAIKREVKEEINLELEDQKYFKKVFVKYPNYDYIYHIFYKTLNDFHDVELNKKEHKDFRWVTPVDALNLPLIPDEDSCIKLFYNIQ